MVHEFGTLERVVPVKRRFCSISSGFELVARFFIRPTNRMGEHRNKPGSNATPPLELLQRSLTALYLPDIGSQLRRA